MVIHFNVHGSGSTLYGDGFAFWYTKDRQELGMCLLSQLLVRTFSKLLIMTESAPTIRMMTVFKLIDNML